LTTLNAADARGSDYTLVSVLIESDRLNKSVEVKNTVTDIDIYEHLDKPYLTGTLAFLDTTNAYTQMDVLGAESVTIKIRSTREDAAVITKKFIISKVIASQKANENSDMLVIQMVEDIAFYSNLQNVNRSYTGNALEISQKIAKNFLNKEIIVGNRTPKQAMKLIVPNLNPLESMVWLKNRAKTVEGLPFYLFSSLTSDKLLMMDLGSLIEEGIINKVPYRYSESAAARSNDPDTKRRIIYSYIQKDMEDLYTMIQKGLIGSQNEFIDVLKNKRQSFHFDLMEDMLKPLLDKGIIQKNQPNVSYSSDYKFNEKSFGQYNSRSISRIGGIDPYRVSDDDPFPLAYGESRTLADYKLNIMSDAVNKLLKKTPMTINIPGVDFIDGDKHSTVGCMLRLEFPISLPNKAPDVSEIDTKKSGDYLVFAARHKFKVDKYDLTLSCLKLANYRAAL
jgi:hypothetical protein